MKKTTIFLPSCLLLFTSCMNHQTKDANKERPNILFIMTDDHGQQAISAYGSSLIQTPNIDRIAQEGMLFRNSFVTNSICGPSRAVLLTGKHSHLNGFTGNNQAFNGEQQTFPKIFQQHGYQTAIIGKWHLKSDPTGFDYWNILPGQGEYYHPDFIKMGMDTIYRGYVTNIITDLTIEWLDKRDKNKPFCLLMHHKAPHREWSPALNTLDMLNDMDFPLPENFYDDYEGREALKIQGLTVREHMHLGSDFKIPCWDCDTNIINSRSLEGHRRFLTRLTPEERRIWDAAYEKEEIIYKNIKHDKTLLDKWKYRRYIQDYLRTIISVDESVGRILKYLQDYGLDKNTVVIYTSDQGFYLGEHGLFDKRFMYEEGMRTPLIIRYPGEIKKQSSSELLVQNLDLAPTFLDIAGISIPKDMQGLSLRGVWKNQTKNWRDALYYHYYEGGWGTTPHYGIRTSSHKLIRFYDKVDSWELFDLEKDPSEMKNVYHDEVYKEVRNSMKEKLSAIRQKYRDTGGQP